MQTGVTLYTLKLKTNSSKLLNTKQYNLTILMMVVYLILIRYIYINDRLIIDISKIIGVLNV